MEKNNPAIAFNVLYAKKEKIYPGYVSKHSNRVKQVLLLMKLNRKGWRSLAVTKLSVLLREITSKHHDNFYCLNCHHLFVTENRREYRKKSM